MRTVSLVLGSSALFSALLLFVLPRDVASAENVVFIFSSFVAASALLLQLNRYDSQNQGSHSLTTYGLRSGTKQDDDARRIATLRDSKRIPFVAALAPPPAEEHRLAPAACTVLRPFVMPCSSAFQAVAQPESPDGFEFGDWEADVAVAVTESQGLFRREPLRLVGYAAASRWKLLGSIVEASVWDRFLCVVEANYKTSNAYHNNTHAADVVHSTMCLIGRCPPLFNSLKPSEKLAILLAAAVHDVGHPGFTNGFLNNRCDPIAMAHNFISPLENQHILLATALLQHPELDCTAKLSMADAQSVMRLLGRLIIFTDNSNHHDLLHRVSSAVLKPLQTQADTKEIYAVCQTSAEDKHINIDKIAKFLASSDAARHGLLALVLHAGDLGALAKPTKVRRA